MSEFPIISQDPGCKTIMKIKVMMSHQHLMPHQIPAVIKAKGYLTTYSFKPGSVYKI